MQCPKCGHEQKNTVECIKCGIIFAKYKAFLDRKNELAEQQGKPKQEQQSGSKISSFIQLIALVAVVAAVTYYFTKPDPLDGGGSRLVVQIDESVSSEGFSEQNSTVSQPASGGKSKGAKRNYSSPVELARMATVSVETPWGTGSGFFIDKNYIVTNKHVIEFNYSELDKAREKLETNRRLIELEEDKLAEVRRQLRQMAKGPSRSQLRIVLKEREKELAKYKRKQDEGEAKLARLEEGAQSPVIKIILSDGTEHTAEYMTLSQNYDLALLTLYAHEGVSLKKPPGGMAIRQGDKVYTVGSPVGLRHTVTAGVFSGYRQREADNQVFLQTDAAINPGNSGGPLIDENGYVYGVNTMILRDTEGIGFAIPIEKVFEEFSSTLP